MKSVLSYNNNFLAFEKYCAIFEKYGDPAKEYLRRCYPRYCKTKLLLTQNWPYTRSRRMLDVGAHWLHHCLLYAMDGFSVTAAELGGISFSSTSLCGPNFLSNPVIKGVAKEFNINRITFKDLSNPLELKELPENSFDLILFTEVIEHITFNPIEMWKTLYNLLSPGGRIIVTTPNYFAGSFFHDVINVFRGKSTGIKINEILEINTFGHHWRIFSAKDLRKYFNLLSPDFIATRLIYFNHVHTKRGLYQYLNEAKRSIKYFRDTLYVEVNLIKKNKGIAIKTHW